MTSWRLVREKKLVQELFLFLDLLCRLDMMPKSKTDGNIIIKNVLGHSGISIYSIKSMQSHGNISWEHWLQKYVILQMFGDNTFDLLLNTLNFAFQFIYYIESSCQMSASYMTAVLLQSTTDSITQCSNLFWGIYWLGSQKLFLLLVLWVSYGHIISLEWNIFLHSQPQNDGTSQKSNIILHKTKPGLSEIRLQGRQWFFDGLHWTKFLFLNAQPEQEEARGVESTASWWVWWVVVKRNSVIW